MLLALPCFSVQIFVRGLEGKTITLDVELNDNVLGIKEKIEAKIKVPLGFQRLVYEGKQLSDDKTLLEYNITKDSTLHLLLRLRAGELF